MNAHDNTLDLLTKVLPMSEKRQEFFWMLQHHIFGSFPEETAVAQCWNDCWDQALYFEYLIMRIQTRYHFVISFGIWVLDILTSSNKGEYQEKLC